ncbi:LPXTG cell wall anchor domain-containing protein [Streptomyces sp. NBC_01304]|uniref:LPXTG cell wall anchor domain-containing protein n=1 Tax=Streptomyces sp. NBC_01304 TaxID=2903818 RepID=UPI002E13CACF|nr:LPXTG cell wall anchor domain-containing protein [Streptomyces sp. NBC_01304]
MSPARRSLLTATAAGTLLGALWFVPSANARSAAEASSDRPDRGEARLADTGTVDTTPYVLGGLAFLGAGAGFLGFAVRRERAAVA